MSTAALLAGAACRTAARADESSAERLSGCFRRIYGDGPPPGMSGRVLYTLTTDDGATRLLEVSSAVLDSAGGPTRLDRTRVTVLLAPAPDSSHAPARASRVRELRRASGGSEASC